MSPDQNHRLKLSVLIVSDEARIKSLFDKSIDGSDFEITTVESPKQAISIIESKLFPIIFIDNSLPDNEGLKFYNTVKKKTGRQALYTIMIVNSEDFQHETRPYGQFDYYLFQPLNKFKLQNCLNNARRTILGAASRSNLKRKLKVVTDELESARREQSRLEEQLKTYTESQYIENGKLEAIGRMSAGIAHEINTPVQYVGDNIHFLRDSFEEIGHILSSYKDLYRTLKDNRDSDSAISALESLLDKYDLNYLEEEIPETIRQSMEGLDRISGIVLAMRNMSHAGRDDKATVNINEAIKNTITLTRNEWKYVAEIKTDFTSPLPDVACHPGEFNQVILNMIINAAHAIKDSFESSDAPKGLIELITRKNMGKAEIIIRDSGIGIPSNLSDKIFQPFFTTKKAGKGTGQGLAISNSVIKTYEGNIAIESEPGKGATFIITLPFCMPDESPSISLEPSLPDLNPHSGSEIKTPKNILFVDDDPDIIKGLQRMLHHLSKEWDMVFTGNASEALLQLQKKEFDVIVTDCRMSGMSGIDLLSDVQTRYPQVVRIMLSGETDKEILMKAVRVVHQFIAKPCDADLLKKTIYRTCMMRELLTDEPLLKALSGIESLPAAPSLYTAITNELKEPESSLKKIGKIISDDLAMTAKVLQLVNSAYFGLPTHIESPETAVIMLGMETVQSLILHFEMFSKFKIKKEFNPFLERLKDHNLAVGDLSRKIADKLNFDAVSKDQAFMGGLLHDCGQLVLLANFPDKYEKVLKLFNNNNMTLIDCEKAIFNITHAEAGAYLMGIWGLPAPIVEAIHFHHSPFKSIGTDMSPLTAVHIANIIHKTGSEKEDTAIKYMIDTDYLNHLGISDRINEFNELLLNDE